jgi:hypothetical protein
MVLIRDNGLGNTRNFSRQVLDVLPFPADRPPQPPAVGSSLDRLNQFLTAETVRHAWLGTGAMATYAPIVQAPIVQAPITQDPITQDPITGSAWIAIAWIQPESVARLRTHAEAEHWQVSASASPLGSSLTLIDTLVAPETAAQFTLIPVSDCHLIADPGTQGDRPIAPDWPDYAWAVLKRREVLRRSQLGWIEDGESVPMWIAAPEDLLLVRLLERRGDRSDPGGSGAIRSALGDWWRSLQQPLANQPTNAQPDTQQPDAQRRLNVCYLQEWSDRLGVATHCDQILLHH